MDRVVEARLVAVRARIGQLGAEEERLLAQLQHVREQLGAARDEQRHVEDAAQRAGRHSRNIVAEETWRRAVQRLGRFTPSELAAELGVSIGTARKHLDALTESGIVAPYGRLGRTPMFTYKKPDDAGAAFKAQRRLHTVDPVDVGPTRAYSGPVAGTGSHPADVISHPAVRKVVKAAIADGWTLRAKGDGHWDLVKDGSKVGVASTPKNPTAAAVRIARLVRGAGRVAA